MKKHAELIASAVIAAVVLSVVMLIRPCQKFDAPCIITCVLGFLFVMLMIYRSNNKEL